MASVVSIAGSPVAPPLGISAEQPRARILLPYPIRTSSGIRIRALGSSSSRRRKPISLSPRASVGGGVDYIVEPTTNVKFPQAMRVPGCSKTFVILGAGYREKVFAVVGVKVYSAAFYVEASIVDDLDGWKKQLGIKTFEASPVFKSIFEAPIEKSLSIILLRHVEGKTFWNALDDVMKPRIKELTAEDESALSTFRKAFLERGSLRKGTSIYLTWVEPSRMLVSISDSGRPSQVDAEIKSLNVCAALYDGFFGNSPVSPSLKSFVSDGLQKILR